MGWKSDKEGNHFNDKKMIRSSEPSTEVNVEIDNNSDDFSEGVKKDFENMSQPFEVNISKKLSEKITSMTDSELKDFITDKNNELNRKEIMYGVKALKNRADDEMAEMVAQGITEAKRRANKEFSERVKELDSDEVTIAIKRLAESSDFELSDDHTFGWISGDVVLPTYGSGVVFAQKPIDSERDVYRFGRDGYGGTELVSNVDIKYLKNILQNAKEIDAIGKYAGVRDLLNASDIQTSEQGNRPIILRLKGLSYFIAPKVFD